MTPNSHPWLGKLLMDVSGQIQAECDRCGFTFAVLDPTSPPNVDREPERLDVHVDGNFKIIAVTVG
jgi:hypothetical protein